MIQFKAMGKTPSKLRKWAEAIGNRPELRCGYSQCVIRSAADQMEKLEQDIQGMAPHPKLKDAFPVVLYFKTDQERAEFVALVQDAKPNLLEVKL